MNLDLTDEETAALLRELDALIGAQGAEAQPGPPMTLGAAAVLA